MLGARHRPEPDPEQPQLNPVDRPENLLRFLCHIAEQGGWAVNLDIRID